MYSLNLFDWFLLAILLYSTIRAFLCGIFRELFALAGVTLGILLASWNYPRVAVMLGRFISTPTAAQLVAFFLILVTVNILCSLLGRLLSQTARAIGLGFFDRLLGAVFGLARGCLLAVAIMMAAAAFYPQTESISKSSLAPYFLAGAHAVSFVVPHDMQQRISNGAEQLKHTAPDWIKPHG
jgi:membrane protein required for colicin V production